MKEGYANPPKESLSSRHSTGVSGRDADWISFQDAIDAGTIDAHEPGTCDSVDSWIAYLDWHDDRDGVVPPEPADPSALARIPRLPRFRLDVEGFDADTLVHPFCWSPRYVHESLRLTSGESSHRGNLSERLAGKKCGQCPGCKAWRVVTQAVKIACGLMLWPSDVAHYGIASRRRIETITRRIERAASALPSDAEHVAWALVEDLPDHLSVGHASSRFELVKLFLADDDAKSPGGVILVSSVRPESKRGEEKWRALSLEPSNVLKHGIRWAHRLQHGTRGQASTRGTDNWSRETPTHRSRWYPHGNVDDVNDVVKSLRSEGVDVRASQTAFRFVRPENVRTVGESGDEADYFNHRHNLRGTGAPSLDEHPLDSYGEQISEARDQFQRAAFRVCESIDPILADRARRAGRKVYDPDRAWALAVDRLERFGRSYTLCLRGMLQELTYPIDR